MNRPHRLAPHLALVAAAVLAPACLAAPTCPAGVPTELVERVMPADCEACWREAAPAPGPGAVVLDWIAPAGGDAPMAAVAQADALTRAAPAAGATAVRRSPLPHRRRAALEVNSGPPLNGYIGLRLSIFRRAALPPDAQAFLALVERVPAGSEGSPVARQVVHGVAGPVSLAGLATRRELIHWFAMALPETARPERLAAAGWLQTAQGEVIAAAQSDDADCAPAQAPRPRPDKPRR